MDFQTLNRRELQALCKLNKIPANITNIAMIDALKSLQTVEGIEVFMNHSRTETVGLPIESPEITEITSTRKKAKLEHNEVLKPPLVSCTKKKDPETSFFHDVASQLNECEDISKNQSLVNHEKICIPNTPVAVVGTTTYSQMELTESTYKETVKKETTTTTTVQRAYSTRRSTRLTAMNSQKKHDVIVLDESDEDSEIEKVVHVNDITTTLENEERVDCCGDVDSLKVKSVKIFELLEDVEFEERQNGGEKFDNSNEKNGHVDNLKPDLEGICNRSGPSKLDNRNVDEVMDEEGIEENISRNTVVNKGTPIEEKHDVIVLDGNKRIEKVADVDMTTLESGEEKVDCCSSEVDNLKVKSVERSDQVEDVDLEFGMNEGDNLKPDSDRFLTSENPIDPSVLETNGDPNAVGDLICKITENPSELSKLHHPNNHYVAEVTTAQGIEENISTNTGDVVVVAFVNNPNKQEASMDLEEPQNTLMDPIYDLNSQQLNQQDHGDVDSSNEENQFSTNERKPEVVVIEENHEKGLNEKANKSLISTSISLRQLKKQVKATLSNSPMSIKIKTEASDNRDTKKVVVVVVEENEEEINEKKGTEGDDNKAKSLNNTSSLRQLKKQLKALVGKCNKETS